MLPLHLTLLNSRISLGAILFHGPPPECEGIAVLTIWAGCIEDRVHRTQDPSSPPSSTHHINA